MKVRFIWYADLALLGAAFLVLVVGLFSLGTGSGRSSQEAGAGQSATNGLSDSLGDLDQADGTLSPLVNSVRDFSRRWEPPTGTVRIVIEPQEARDGGAAWRLGQGKWHASGKEVDYVKVGQQGIELKEVAGYLQPASVMVDVKKRETVEQTVTYQVKPPPTFGQVKVAILPDEVLAIGAAWKVAGREWQDSEAVLEEVPTGSQSISLKPVDGWVPPAGLRVDVVEGQQGIVTASYTKKPEPKTTLKITLQPSQAASAGGQWRIRKCQPLSEDITVADSEGKGEWLWQKSGDLLSDLAPGSYEIEYEDVSGWVAPSVMDVKVKQGEANVFTATYEKVQLKPPKCTLTGTVAMAGGQGIAWLQNPGENRDEAYFIGEKIDGYELIEVLDGKVVLKREGAEYPLTVSTEQRSAAGPEAEQEKERQRREVRSRVRPPRPDRGRPDEPKKP